MSNTRWPQALFTVWKFSPLLSKNHCRRGVGVGPGGLRSPSASGSRLSGHHVRNGCRAKEVASTGHWALWGAISGYSRKLSRSIRLPSAASPVRGAFSWNWGSMLRAGFKGRCASVSELGSESVTCKRIVADNMQPVPRGPGARLQHQGSNSSSGHEWTVKAWDDTKRALQASCGSLGQDAAGGGGGGGGNGRGWPDSTRPSHCRAVWDSWDRQADGRRVGNRVLS